MSFVYWGIRDNVIPLLPFPNQVLNYFISEAYVALLVLLPVTGWISDSLLGRYRAITVGSFLIEVTLLVIMIAFVMLQFDWTIPAFALTYISVSVTSFSGGTFFISSLPFIVRQICA